MKSPFAQVVEPESPGTGLAVPLGDVNEVFKPGGTAIFISAVKAHVASLKPQLDISTPEGRDFIVSTAYKITKTKTYALAKCKECTDYLKSKAKAMDKEAAFMAAELTALSHATRKPVTDRENEGAERAADFELKLGEIYNSCLFVGEATIEAIQQRMAKLRSYQAIEWAEYSERAKQGFAECFPALEAMLRVAEQKEADRIELLELRKLKAMQIPATAESSAALAAECRAESYRQYEAKLARDGEAIPPRERESAVPMNEIEDDIFNDLEFHCDFLDLDQAQDVLNAIKAGKIRHVQIVY